MLKRRHLATCHDQNALEQVKKCHQDTIINHDFRSAFSHSTYNELSNELAQSSSKPPPEAPSEQSSFPLGEEPAKQTSQLSSQAPSQLVSELQCQASSEDNTLISGNENNGSLFDKIIQNSTWPVKIMIKSSHFLYSQDGLVAPNYLPNDINLINMMDLFNQNNILIS